MTAGEAGGDELGVGLRRRVTRQLLIGVPLVTAWAIFAVKGPAWLVERADKSSKKCLDDAYEAKRDPSGCALGTGFAIARWFPEVREDTKEVERSFRQRRAELTFDHVMASKPNAARRDAAAARLVADAPVKADAAAYAANAGAFGPLAAANPAARSRRSNDPAFAAIVLGDAAAARAALARGDRDGYGVIDTAALACLLGDRARGQALLRAAAQARETDGTPEASVRVCAQHCGGTLDTVGFDPFVVPSFLGDEALIARLYDPKVEAGRRAAIGATLFRGSTILRSVNVAEAALVAGGTVEPSPLLLLEALHGEAVNGISFGEMFDETPWPVSSEMGTEGVDYVPPAWLELAASRYAHAAQVCPARIDGENMRIDADTAQHPRETLHDAAELMYEFDAGYRLRRGDRAGAREALAQWRVLDATDFRRAPLEIAAGDPSAALATLDAWQAQPGSARGNVSQVIAFNRVLALAALGRHQEAFAIAKTLDGMSGGWLVLATAISSGAPLDGLTVTAGGKDDLVTPAVLLTAIRKHTAVHDIVYLRDDERVALPAVMVAIARAAQVAGEDPEVVLDQAFASDMPSRTMALARAEAARWRNDAAAATLWDKRAAAIAALFVDDDAVVLAGVAKLW